MFIIPRSVLIFEFSASGTFSADVRCNSKLQMTKKKVDIADQSDSSEEECQPSKLKIPQRV
jgi:hypothetical protein